MGGLGAEDVVQGVGCLYVVLSVFLVLQGVCGDWGGRVAGGGCTVVFVSDVLGIGLCVVGELGGVDIVADAGLGVGWVGTRVQRGVHIFGTLFFGADFVGLVF